MNTDVLFSVWHLFLTFCRIALSGMNSLLRKWAAVVGANHNPLSRRNGPFTPSHPRLVNMRTWNDGWRLGTMGRHLHLTSVWPPQHSGVNSSDTQVLTLYNVTEEESGEYICKVSNYIGAANQSAWLTVTKHAYTGKTPPTGAYRGNKAIKNREAGGYSGTDRQTGEELSKQLGANINTHLSLPPSLLFSSGAPDCEWCHGKTQQSWLEVFELSLMLDSVFLSSSLCYPVPS